MTIEELKINLQIAWVRLRTVFRTAIRLLGVVLLLLGAYNLFAPPLLSADVFMTGYRQFFVAVTANGQSAYYVGDILLIASGAVIGWFA